jgi:hypothetical protein
MNVLVQIFSVETYNRLLKVNIKWGCRAKQGAAQELLAVYPISYTQNTLTFLIFTTFLILILHINAGVKIIWIAERSIVDWELVAARVSDNRKNWWWSVQDQCKQLRATYDIIVQNSTELSVDWVQNAVPSLSLILPRNTKIMLDLHNRAISDVSKSKIHFKNDHPSINRGSPELPAAQAL